MVKLTKIYTRGGDGGQTSLGSGARVAKHDARVEAYGDVDEANAAIGVARLHVSDAMDGLLATIQNDLFDVGADLCTPGEAFDDPKQLRAKESQVERLEVEIDEMNANLAALTSFVLPGGSAAAAHLHVARTVTRRAERRITALAAIEPVNPAVIRYLNRLSDLLFVASRVANDDGRADVLWVPGANR